VAVAAVPTCRAEHCGFSQLWELIAVAGAQATPRGRLMKSGQFGVGFQITGLG